VTTTAVFVELLVTGLLALIWLALTFLSATGMSWSDLMAVTGVKEKESVTSILILCFAYVLGIVVDRAADSLFHPIDMNIRKRRIDAKLPSVSEMRMYVMSSSERLASFLGYLRSRLRLARSSSLNFLLVTVTALIFLSTRTSTEKVVVIAVTVCGLGVFASSSFAWVRISRTYYKRLAQAYELLKKQEHHRNKAPQTTP